MVEMGSDLTLAYFWPAVNKRQTRYWPSYVLKWHEEICFDPKLKSLVFLEEIFQTQTQTKDPNPDPNQRWVTQPDPGQKILTQSQHYLMGYKHI